MMQGVGSFHQQMMMPDPISGGASPDEDPPYSRLFVSCPAHYTKDFIQQQFSAFGNVQSVKLITDKTTREFKGLCFVKFDRASSAALAKESMDGSQLDTEGGPMKVSFAVPRGAPKNTAEDGEFPPRSRLFATFLKTTPEEVVTQRFAQFGDLEYAKVLTQPRTGEGRGIAYIKYSKTSTAMRAMEDIHEQEQISPTPGQPYRIRVAEPAHVPGTGRQSAPPPMQMQMQQMQQLQHMHLLAQAQHQVHPTNQTGLPMWKNPQIANQRIDNNTPPGSRLWFSLAKRLPVEYLQQLFGRYGFLESIYIMKDRNCGYAKYNSAPAAASAAAALNMMEISEGVTAKVAIANPQIEGITVPTTNKRR